MIVLPRRSDTPFCYWEYGAEAQRWFLPWLAIGLLVCSEVLIRNPTLSILWPCFLWPSLGQIVEGLQTPEPVAFLDSSVRFRVPSEVIGKDEEVTLSSESQRVDEANKVGVDELVRIICSLLRFAIIDLGCLRSLTTIVYDLIWLVHKVNVKAPEVLSKRSEVEVPESSLPSCEAFLWCWRTCLMNKTVRPTIKVGTGDDKLDSYVGQIDRP